MKLPRPTRARVHLIGIILLITLQGCAHTPPPSPLPESLQQQLGQIGVVATTTEGQQAFGSPGTGRLSNIWKGASLFAAVGAGVGAHGSYMAPIMVPAGAAIGLVGGAFYGAVASESWQNADRAFQSIVAELDLNQALTQHLTAFAQAHGYALTQLSTIVQEGPQHQSRYATARNDGIDTVLEIQDLTVNLVPAEYMVNPHRVLTLSARVQLIRTVDQTLLDDRVVIDKFGPALLLDGWTANQAIRFRQEVQQATERLAEQIITEYFLLYPFPDRVTDSGLFLDVHLKGLQRYYPGESPDHFGHKTVHEKDIRAKYSWDDFLGLSPRLPAEFLILAQSRVDSLQPTMSWETFPGSNVTYDLKIWRSGRLGPDTLVYSRTNLDQPTHKLETALEPSSLYYWSVRAHFTEQGRERITDWSRRSITNSLTVKIMTLGILAVMPDPVAEGFFVFITPPPSPKPQPAEAQSQ
ncbi:MAG: hypothetical protein HP496_01525 [Nitrospira sp.]|nr:hypothetical protein [Nitrospira sp.]